MQNVVTPAADAPPDRPTGLSLRRPRTPRGSLYDTVVLWLLLALLPAVAGAQSFTGNAPRATPLFHLAEGLSVFEMAHRGAGEFTVRLLDSDGRQVSELARTSGPYEGSRAIGIEREGEYLLDVDARGEWSVTLRGPGSPTPGAQPAMPAPPAAPRSTTAARSPADSASMADGLEAGRAAAGRLDGRWFLGGLLGGTVAGPLGLGAAVHFAGRGAATLPAPPRGDPSFAEGFREGFESRARLNRRKSAFVGGMLGTAIFTTALIHILDISGKGGGAPDPGGGTGPLRVAR